MVFALPMGFWLVEAFASSRLQVPVGLPIGSLLRRTIALSASVSVSGAILAVPMALVWVLGNRLERIALTLLVFTPLLVGLLARNYAWIGVLSWLTQHGGLAHALGELLLYRPLGVGVVMAFLVAPMSFFILVQTLRAVPPVQVDAAISLGVRPQRLLSGFYLRILRRPLILAVLFNFCWSAGFFITPRMVGGGNFDLLGNVVVEYANLGRFDYSSTIALVLFAVCVCPVLGLVIYATRLRKLQLGT